jgi:hypothetical protein
MSERDLSVTYKLMAMHKTAISDYLRATTGDGSDDAVQKYVMRLLYPIFDQVIREETQRVTIEYLRTPEGRHAANDDRERTNS